MLLDGLPQGRRDDAEGVLATMQAAGVSPDTVTFSSLIVPSDAEQQPSQAAEWLEAMSAAGLAPDLLAFNKVLRPPSSHLCSLPSSHRCSHPHLCSILSPFRPGHRLLWPCSLT
jgi:hypothetical protein